VTAQLSESGLRVRLDVVGKIQSVKAVHAYQQNVFDFVGIQFIVRADWTRERRAE
jgi:hypothetical protein